MSIDDLIKLTEETNINFSFGYLVDRIKDRYRWPFRYYSGQPTVEIILEDGIKTDCIFSADGYVDPNQVLKYYEDGYTVLLSRIQTLHPDIINLAHIVNKYCNLEVNMNIYFGKGLSSVSFPKHTHEYPVLVKSVQGSSEWLIDNKNITLDGQKVIFFDKNIEHEVIKINSPKITITCNLIKLG